MDESKLVDDFFPTREIALAFVRSQETVRVRCKGCCRCCLLSAACGFAAGVAVTSSCDVIVGYLGVCPTLQVPDEMATDAHTKMEFVEFLEALGMISEIRVSNQHKLDGTRKSRKQRATEDAEDATEDDETEAEAEEPLVAAGAGASGRDSPSSVIVGASEAATYVPHHEFVWELINVVLNRICTVVDPDRDA